MQTIEEDFVDRFIADGENRYTFDGDTPFDQRFSAKAIRLVLRYRFGSDQLGQFASLIEMGMHHSLGEPVERVGGTISITATKSMFELNIHRSLIEALDLVAKNRSIPEADRLRATELKEDLDGR